MQTLLLPLFAIGDSSSCLQRLQFGTSVKEKDRVHVTALPGIDICHFVNSLTTFIL